MTVFLIVGPPAVGKSTVSRLVAQARPRCVLVDVDRFRDTMVVTGMVLPSPDWPPELVRQLSAARRSAAGVARAYAAIGFDVVIDDFLDPHSLLVEYDDLADLDPVRVVLLPESRVAHERNQERGSGGSYIDEGIAYVYERMPTDDALLERGWRVLDTTNEGPEDTCVRILTLAPADGSGDV